MEVREGQGAQRRGRGSGASTARTRSSRTAWKASDDVETAGRTSSTPSTHSGRDRLRTADHPHGLDRGLRRPSPPGTTAPPARRSARRRAAGSPGGAPGRRRAPPRRPRRPAVRPCPGPRRAPPPAAPGRARSACRPRAGRSPSSIDCSSPGSIMMTRSVPASMCGATTAGPSAARAASTSPSGSFETFARSVSASRMRGRSLIGTCSASSPCSTRCTSASDSSAGMSSSTAGGFTCLTPSVSRRTSSRVSSRAGVRRDDRRQVRDEHRDAVDHRRAAELGAVPHLGRDPLAGRPNTGSTVGVPGRLSSASPRASTRPDGRLPAPGLDARDLDDVRRRRQLDAVAGAHRRHDDAELERDLAPQGAHPGEQVVATPR